MNTVFQKIPFLRITLALAAGIVLGKIIEVPSSVLLAFIISNLIILILLNTNYRFSFENSFGFFVLTLFILMGKFVCTQKNKTPEFYAEGIFQATVLEKPQEKQRSYKAVLQINAVGTPDTVVATREKTLVYFEKSEEVEKLLPGQVILFQTPPQFVKNFGSPYSFDYKAYLQQSGIYRQVFLSGDKWDISAIEQRSLKIRAELIREKLRSIYHHQNLGDNETEILSALTLGYKRDLDPETKRIFSVAGAMHVLAVSGLHVGILFMVFSMLFSHLRRQKTGRMIFVVLSISLLWVYAFITGLPPSVLRAATMFCIVIIGSNLKRRSSIYNSLAASALFLLLVDPNHLFNIGFQLSYSAVFGIVFLQPRLAALWPVKNSLLKYFVDLLSVSLAAQIATFPLTAYYFMQFPAYFLLSNLIVIPAVILLIPLGLSLLLVGKIPLMGKVVAFLVHWLIKIVYDALASIEQLPHATFNLSLSRVELLFLILFLLFLYAFINKKRALALQLTLAAGLLFSLTSLLNTYKRNTSREIIVFDHSANRSIHLISGKRNYVISEKEITEDDPVRRHVKDIEQAKCLEKPIFLLADSNFENEHLYLNNGIIAFESKTIQFNLKAPDSKSNFCFNYVILHPKHKLDQLHLESKTRYISNAFAKACETERKVYSLTMNGAYCEEWK